MNHYRDRSPLNASCIEAGADRWQCQLFYEPDYFTVVDVVRDATTGTISLTEAPSA